MFTDLRCSGVIGHSYPLQEPVLVPGITRCLS